MARALVCEHCGKAVESRSFRMLASCPHCGRALKGEFAMSTQRRARGVSWVLHLLRLFAAMIVAAGGIWLFCSLLWNPTGLIYFPCQTHRGTMMVVAGGGLLISGFVALREAVRLKRLRSIAAGDDRSEATLQG